MTEREIVAGILAIIQGALTFTLIKTNNEIWGILTIALFPIILAILYL